MPWCNCDSGSCYDIQDINADSYTKDIKCNRCGSTRSDKDVIILLLQEMQDLKEKVMELERYKEMKEVIEWEEEQKILEEDKRVIERENKKTARFEILDL